MTSFDPHYEDRKAAEKRQKNLELIDDLFKDEGYLTAWEVGFLRNIETRLKNRHDLSDKQQACLDDIVKKALERLD